MNPVITSASLVRPLEGEAKNVVGEDLASFPGLLPTAYAFRAT
jgi:hypothetical protein